MPDGKFAQSQSFERNLVPLGIATSLLAAGLLVVSIATGVTQESFEVAAPADDYARRLVASSGPLKALFTIDIAFIAAYTGFFLAWAARLRREGAERWAVAVGLALMIATAVLDLIEDGHILALLRAAEHGIRPSELSLIWQMTESFVKFTLSYIGIAVLAVAWTPEGAFSRGVRALLVLQLPIGAAAFTVPEPYLTLIYFGRAVFFIAGPLLLIASLKRQA